MTYDYPEVAGAMGSEALLRRPAGIWRYRELLPIEREDAIVSLGEGATFLHRCERLGEALGARRLLVKDETTNPTGSFVDRGASVVTSRAKELGASAICCATTGNHGASLAAYAAKAGLECAIYIPSIIDVGKLFQMIAFGARVEPSLSYDHALSSATLEKASYLVTPADPFFLEGLKSTGFEICEALEWHLPNRIIVPVGNGGHISMIHRGIKQLEAIGLIPSADVKMTGVQLHESAPVVAAFHGEEEAVVRRGGSFAPDMIAPKPLLGGLAVDAIKESGGSAVSVTDREILEATSLIARTEGIFAEPAAASTIAGLRRLLDSGAVDRDEEVVCVVTGSGLKDPRTARRLVRARKNVELVVRTSEERGLPANIGSTKIKILRIISGGDSYAYGIWSKLRHDLKLVIRIPSVYQHLAELEAMDLVRRAKTVRVLGRPFRHYYGLTERGRSILRSITGS